MNTATKIASTENEQHGHLLADALPCPFCGEKEPHTVFVAAEWGNVICVECPTCRALVPLGWWQNRVEQSNQTTGKE